MSRAVAVDSLTTLVPSPGGFTAEQVDDDRRPTRFRRSAAYKTSADALRALIRDEVKWGAWQAVGRER